MVVLEISTLFNEARAPNPSVLVATHRVLVPVLCSTIPRVPALLVESRKRPAKVRLVEVALVKVAVPVAVRLLKVAVPAKAGEVLKTLKPVPVSSVSALIKFALDGVPRKVATLVPRPLTPVLIGRPVPLVRVTDCGIPRIGERKVGEFEKTAVPVPVSSVRLLMRAADSAVVVAIDEASVKSAREAVELERVKLPITVGAVRTDDDARTNPPPVPFSSERIAASSADVVKVLLKPRLEVATHRVLVPVLCKTIPRVPALLVESRKRPAKVRLVEVALVKVAVPVAVRLLKVAVPAKAGEVLKTLKPVPVSSVSALIKFALDGVPRKVATLVPRPLTPVLIGRPVPLVRVTDCGIPRIGERKVGEFEKTAVPVPVSSVSEARRSAEAAVVVALFELSRKRPREAVRPLKVTVPVAVRPLKVAVPAKAGEVLKTLKPVPVSSERIAARPAEVLNDEPIPRVLVATQRVEVPVLCSTIPRVPPLLVLS